MQDGGGGRAVGVLGAAFNPPHVGHLLLAQEAAAQLQLAEVLLVPTGRAPHKEVEDDPGPRVRLEMVRLAAAGTGLVRADDIEVRAAEEDTAPSYTYATLEALRRERGHADMTLLMGSDAAAGLERWKEPGRVLALARLGIAERLGIGRGEVQPVLERLGAGERAAFIAMPHIGISSTMVRDRVATGHPIRYLVPDPVARMIAERGLYRSAGSRRPGTGVAR